MLISLHLPKTAGTSFFYSLEEHFGNKLARDYADLPINTPTLKRNTHALKMCVKNGIQLGHKHDCIHGHFLPMKYLFCRNAKFVTWMRNPIERLASHYHYWQRNYDPKTSANLHKIVIEEQWSLEKFCLCPELENLYSKFLWGFPLKKFNFIGITEYYETELTYFSKHFLNAEISHIEKNKNPDRVSKNYIEDPSLLKKIRETHDNDFSIYQYALNKRLSRTAHNQK